MSNAAARILSTFAAISGVASKARRSLTAQGMSAGTASRTASRIAIAPSGSASQWPPRALRSIFLTGQARLTSIVVNVWAGLEEETEWGTDEVGVVSRSAVGSNQPT